MTRVPPTQQVKRSKVDGNFNSSSCPLIGLSSPPAAVNSETIWGRLLLHQLLCHEQLSRPDLTGMGCDAMEEQFRYSYLINSQEMGWADQKGDHRN